MQNAHMCNHTTQYKPPLPRRQAGAAQGDLLDTTSAPPGSSLVTRNTNFSATYSIGGEEASRHGKLPGQTRKPSGGARTIVPRRLSGGGPGGNTSAARAGVAGTLGGNLPGSTPTTRQPAIAGGTTVVRQTSFSKWASGTVEHETVEPGVGTRMNTGGGSIVKKTISRQLSSTYEEPSDAFQPNGYSPRSGRRNLLTRGMQNGTARVLHSHERIGSTGGSDRSSSPPSEGEGQHPRLAAVQPRRGPLKRYALYTILPWVQESRMQFIKTI